MSVDRLDWDDFVATWRRPADTGDDTQRASAVRAAEVLIAEAEMRQLEARKMVGGARYAKLLAFVEEATTEPDPLAFAQERWPAGHPKGGQFKPQGGGAGAGSRGGGLEVGAQVPAKYKNKTEWIKDLHKQGKSVIDISKEIGVSRGQVRYAIVGRGSGKTQKPPEPKAAEKPKAKEPSNPDEYGAAASQFIGGDAIGNKKSWNTKPVNLNDGSLHTTNTENAKAVHDALKEMNGAFPQGSVSLRAVTVSNAPAKAEKYEPIAGSAYARYLPAARVIELNTLFASNLLEKSLLGGEASGFHPSVPPGHSVRAVITHEFGHHLDYQAQMRLTMIAEKASKAGDKKTADRAQKLWDNYQKFTGGSSHYTGNTELPSSKVTSPIRKNPVSGYAKTNRQEAIAEAFTAGWHNPSKYPLGKQLVDMFKEIYSPWGKDYDL